MALYQRCDVSNLRGFFDLGISIIVTKDGNFFEKGGGRYYLKVFLAGKAIASPWMIFVILIMVILGYGVVHLIANRKWGYTPKRERELEEMEKQEK